MSFVLAGKIWSVEGFEDYLKTITPPAWAKAVCLHHTAAPSLKQRPNGLLANHIENLRSYYKNDLGWSAGPHIFIDEDQAFGMSPLTEKGVHAVSFNSKAIGIEVLGDFDSEDPKSGRGLLCWETAALVTKALLKWLKLPINSQTVLFHRDDPKTSKTCPGTKVQKDWVIGLMNNAKAAVAPTIIEDKGAFQPVIDYVVKYKGYDYDKAVSLLHRKDNMYFFGEDWLEGARYDSKAQSTVAPIKELESIVRA